MVQTFLVWVLTAVGALADCNPQQILPAETCHFPVELFNWKQVLLACDVIRLLCCQGSLVKMAYERLPERRGLWLSDSRCWGPGTSCWPLIERLLLVLTWREYQE